MANAVTLDPDTKQEAPLGSNYSNDPSNEERECREAKRRMMNRSKADIHICAD